MYILTLKVPYSFSTAEIIFCYCFQDGKFHALKIFQPHAVKDINREIAALQKLKHENIINFIGVENEVII